MNCPCNLIPPRGEHGEGCEFKNGVELSDLGREVLEYAASKRPTPSEIEKEFDERFPYALTHQKCLQPEGKEVHDLKAFLLEKVEEARKGDPQALADMYSRGVEVGQAALRTAFRERVEGMKRNTDKQLETMSDVANLGYNEALRDLLTALTEEPHTEV